MITTTTTTIIIKIIIIIIIILSKALGSGEVYCYRILIILTIVSLIIIILNIFSSIICLIGWQFVGIWLDKDKIRYKNNNNYI